MIVATIGNAGRRHPSLRDEVGEPRWRCPAAAYGPGDSHLDHVDKEHLEIADFRRSIEVLQFAFARLTSRETAAIARAAIDAL